MNNPFLHSSLSSYSNYKEMYPQSAFTNSRTLTQLELSIPINLLNDYPVSSPPISSHTRSSITHKYTCFPTPQTRTVTNPLPKENPFLTAKPYRLYDRASDANERKGLTGWERRRYLQRFATENVENSQGFKGYGIPLSDREQEKRVDMTRSAKVEHSPNSKNLKRTFTFQSTSIPEPQRQQITHPPQQNYSFSYEDPSLQLAYNPVYTKEVKDSSPIPNSIPDSTLRNIIRKPSDRAKKYQQDQQSLINKLDSHSQLRPAIKTISSNVYDFQYDQNQFQDYYRPNPIPPPSPPSSRPVPSPSPFKTTQSRLLSYPQSLLLGNTKYELIRLC